MVNDSRGVVELIVVTRYDETREPCADGGVNDSRARMVDHRIELTERVAVRDKRMDTDAIGALFTGLAGILGLAERDYEVHVWQLLRERYYFFHEGLLCPHQMRAMTDQHPRTLRRENVRGLLFRRHKQRTDHLKGSRPIALEFKFAYAEAEQRLGRVDDFGAVGAVYTVDSEGGEFLPEDSGHRALECVDGSASRGIAHAAERVAQWTPTAAVRRRPAPHINRCRRSACADPRDLQTFANWTEHDGDGVRNYHVRRVGLPKLDQFIAHRGKESQVLFQLLDEFERIAADGGVGVGDRFESVKSDGVKRRGLDAARLEYGELPRPGNEIDQIARIPRGNGEDQQWIEVAGERRGYEGDSHGLERSSLTIPRTSLESQ